MKTERFAPSPTGLLHLGHAYSAALGWISARSSSGRFLLRMEDLDTGRCRSEFYDAIYEDLAWLGIDWDGDVLCQSTRLMAYGDAMRKLLDLGVVYRCRCTRKDVQAAISAPQEGVGLDGPVYPGTCRNAHIAEDAPHALRLDLELAFRVLSRGPRTASLSYTSQCQSGSISTVAVSPEQLLANTGDVVLRRKDSAPAYHLAVVVDDAFQNISHVTRGADLAAATPLHRVLQALLELPTPIYHHHKLIRDAEGKRLAKRDHARSLRTLRSEGVTRDEIYDRLGLTGHVSGLLL